MSSITQFQSTLTVQQPSWWASLKNLLVELDRRRRFKNLMSLDDRMLRDIGLDRGDIFWGMSLPLSENASVLAHDRARNRRHRISPVTLKRR